jgi:hypothetical protein
MDDRRVGEFQAPPFALKHAHLSVVISIKITLAYLRHSTFKVRCVKVKSKDFPSNRLDTGTSAAVYCIFFRRALDAA